MTSLAEELQPIDWETIEDAIYDWLTGAVEGFSAIVPEAIWENQNIPQPAYPYASLLVTSHTKEGGRDEIRASYDAARPLGQEIELLATGPVQFTLALSFHVDAAQGGNESASRARSLAAKAQASLGLPAVIDHLGAAGLSIVAEEGVVDTSVVINGEWLSRATIDVRLRTASQMTQRLGYIDKVELESSQLDVDTIVDAS